MDLLNNPRRVGMSMRCWVAFGLFGTFVALGRAGTVEVELLVNHPSAELAAEEIGLWLAKASGGAGEGFAVEIGGGGR